MTNAFGALAQRAAAWAGSPWFFLANVALIGAWLVWGVVGGFSEFIQIVLTTGLTVTTQLLVILIQATQNRDGRALHLKMDEVLRAVSSARTELARAEDMTADEIEEKIEEIKEEMG